MIVANPRDFIAQPTIQLSTHPTFVDGRLEFGGGLGVDPSAGDEIDPITGVAGDGSFNGESHGRSAVPGPLS